MNKHKAVHIGMTCWGSQKALTPTYIHAHRLATANGAYGTQSYGYDANGNRSSATLNGVTNSYTNAATSNRLQSANGKTYTFDANGNITNDGVHSYTYDARNRLTSLNNGVSYSLNGLGQRIAKMIPGIDTGNTTAGDANGDGLINAQDYSAILNHILGTPASNDADCNQDGQVNVQDLVCINIKINPSLQTAGGKTLFVYDEQGQLIGEYDQTGTPIQETIYLGNLPVAVVKNNVVYRLYADHLNTPRAIADNTNKVVWSWNSDAFGTTAANEDPDGDGVKLNYNLRFPGQYLDQETGLHYNYFRDYDPSIGRYSQSDPIGLRGGLNTYAYTLSNPLKYKDPFGLDAEMCYRPIQGYIIPGQHCFMRFNGDDKNTSSFDPNGVHPDPAPKGAMCEATKGPQNDDCVKREMKKCQNYDFLKNNCCHCAEQAMKTCGQSIPVKKWPNWPINPGPQPGEPGYKP